MPSKETNSENPLSAGDTKLIICLIKHLKGDLPGQIKRNKIMGAGSPKSGEKATPSKRKSVGNDDGGDDEETPVKKARGGRKKVEAADDVEVPAETVKEEDAMADFE